MHALPDGRQAPLSPSAELARLMNAFGALQHLPFTQELTQDITRRRTTHYRLR
jgi:hypothetical protein